MHQVWNMILRGVEALLPVTLTLYLIFWVSGALEQVLHAVITAILPEQYYLPGMGLVAGLLLLYFVGLMMNAWIVQQMFRLGEDFLEKIPLVKSIYASLHDFMDYLSNAEHRKGLTRVVIVSIDGVQLLGFLTRDQVKDMSELSMQDDDVVAVYLPFSYQIGGYTIYVPRSRVKPVDMSMEDAMRLVLTAGLSKTKFSGRK